MRAKQHISITKELVRVLIAVVLINIVGTYVYFRVDLTAEKRYTLKKTSKEILRNLNDIVFVQVYLDGDMPAGLKKMQKEVRDQLNEYKIYAGTNLQYQFINPHAIDNAESRNKLFRELSERGLKPVNIQNKDSEGALSQKIIFPGAIVRYGDYELPVNLLKNSKNEGTYENLQQSVEMIEYEFISAIYNLSSDSLRKIAFIEGHGEYDQYEVGDISRELSRFFQIDRGIIDTLHCLDGYEAVIVAGPQRSFSEKEKLVLDQYIMQGGHVLWFVDGVIINEDSLAAGSTLVLPNDVNLGDMLFRYGLRINYNVVKDMHCNIIPVNTALPGTQAKFVPAPWVYHPLLVPPQQELITKGLDLVLSQYASQIDTLGGQQEIKKTVLLKSSAYARTVNAPLFISLQEVAVAPDEKQYSMSNLPVAVLLEGSFNSAFTNRMLDNIVGKNAFVPLSRSKATSMLVVADADIIRNSVRYTPRGPMISPLGYDRYTNQVFGNAQFIINTLHYMVTDPSLIELRAKKISIRLLDKAKVRNEKIYWQMLNTLAPIVIIIITGIVIQLVRKKKYA